MSSLDRNPTLLAKLEQAHQAHRAQRWEEALRSYQEIVWRCRINWEPKIAAQALHLSGVVLLQRGRWQEATDLILQAIQADAEQAEYFGNLGFSYLQLGEFDKAKEALDRALSLRPSYPEAMNNLGNVYLKKQFIDQAIELFQRLLEQYPDSADGRNSYGVALQKKREWKRSIHEFEKAVALDPQLADAYYNAGLSLYRLHRFQEAKERSLQALSFVPDFPEAYRLLGNIAASQGDHARAIEAYTRTLKLQPNFIEALVDLGNSLSEQRGYERACEAYRRALSIDSSCVEAYFNLGYALQHLGKRHEAIEALEQANRIRAGYSDVLLVPMWQSLCEWEAADSGAKRLLESLDKSTVDSLNPVAPFTIVTLPIPSSSRQQLEAARRYAKGLETLESDQSFWLKSPRYRTVPNQPLRIGYLSGDFREHAVGYLCAELIEAHDRTRFEVYGYSIGPNDASSQRRRFEQAFDQFHDVSASPYHLVADRIRQDRVDILIDLQGHTLQARTQILASRPAPIQVNFLGYPGTMGASFIDYIVVDAFVVPTDQRQFYSERLVTLTGCYQVNDSKATSGLPMFTRRDFGLAEDAFVICSFNSPYKITKPIFEVWMSFLRANERSVLWLLESLPEVSQRLKATAAMMGVSPERLIFAPLLPRREYLARLAMADLFVDSFPVNAHTTASDCLRMGVPILTLSGETFVSRVAGSLLVTFGMDELIAKSIDEYQAKGLFWIQHPQEHSRLRSRLQAKLDQTDQFDGRSFARKFEVGLEEMWSNYERSVADWKAQFALTRG